MYPTLLKSAVISPVWIYPEYETPTRVAIKKY